MNYPRWGQLYLDEFDIKLYPNSECWGRTHAHGYIGNPDSEKKICKMALPKTRLSLFDFLHEVGHIVHPQGGYAGSKDGNPAKTRALAEYNATQWAIKEMQRRIGVAVPRKRAQEYNRYVKCKIARGLRRGLKRIPKEIRRLKPASW
jgi:hypothetical protein